MGVKKKKRGKKGKKKSRPHAFANWHSQTVKLIKDEKAFRRSTSAFWIALSRLCHLKPVGYTTEKAQL